jgi:hypothetical protein
LIGRAFVRTANKINNGFSFVGKNEIFILRSILVVFEQTMDVRQTRVLQSEMKNCYQHSSDRTLSKQSGSDLCTPGSDFHSYAREKDTLLRSNCNPKRFDSRYSSPQKYSNEQFFEHISVSVTFFWLKNFRNFV